MTSLAFEPLNEFLMELCAAYSYTTYDSLCTEVYKYSFLSVIFTFCDNVDV